MPKKPTKLSFESSIEELEKIVEQMESGDITLEESLKYFERGIELTRSCQQVLSSAEQKVEILMQKNGQQQHVSFDSESAPE